MSKELELKFTSPLSPRSDTKSLQINTNKIYLKNVILTTTVLSIAPVATGIMLDPMNFIFFPMSMLFGWMIASFRDAFPPSTRKIKKLLASHGRTLSKEENKMLKSNIQTHRNSYAEKRELNLPIKIKKIRDSLLEFTFAPANDFTTTFYNALTAKNHTLKADIDESKVVKDVLPNSNISQQLEELRVSLANNEDIGYSAVMNENQDLSITFSKVESHGLFEDMRKSLKSDFRSRLDESVSNHQA